MDINSFYFKDHEGNEGVVGIRANRDSDLTRIDLFAVEENEQGPSVVNNLHRIARQVSEELFGVTKFEDFQWTLSTGTIPTFVSFSTVDSELYKIDFSNTFALQGEGIGLQKSLDEHNEAPPFDRSRNILDDDFDRPASVYAIPCDAAENGIFYMKGEYDAPHMRDEFETVLVSTDKLLARIEKDDPKMIKHGSEKHGPGDSLGYADNTGINSQQSVGHFNYGIDGDFSLCAGNADMLTVIKNLDLPYVPITVSRDEAARVKQEMGHGYIGFGAAAPSDRPIYEN